MNTGVGGTIIAAKNRPWEAPVNGRTRSVIPLSSHTEVPHPSGIIFSRGFNYSTLDATFISIVVSPLIPALGT